MENATIKKEIVSISNKVTELSSLNIRLKKALEKTISFLFKIVPDVLISDSLKETIKNYKQYSVQEENIDKNILFNFYITNLSITYYIDKI